MAAMNAAMLFASCSPVDASGPGTPAFDATVDVYEYAPSVVPSIEWSVKVDGEEAFVLPTTEHDVCVFGCDKPVTVVVNSLGGGIQSAKVLPVSKSYDYSLTKGRVSLRLSPGDEAVVEVNGSEEHSLFIFVNPLETDKPDPADPDVRYFKAGTVCDEPNLNLRSGQTLYLEGGAVVKGNITASGADNIAIRGCGIIDSRGLDARGIQLDKVNGLAIENVTLINNINWSTFVARAADVTINNYKVVATENPNHSTGCENDGLDLLGCTDARVTGCFAYCHDDVFCVKSHKWSYAGEVRNVVFEDCTAWNYLSGNSFVIGAETEQNISGVTYRNCRSIHSGGRPTTLYRGGLGIHHCAGGHVSDILFENMVLEDCKEYGIYIDIRETNYQIGDGVTWRPGTMDGITLRNVTLLHQAKYKNVFYGYDDSEHSIRNVMIENLVIDGKKVEAADIRKMFFALKNAEYTVE